LFKQSKKTLAEEAHKENKEMKSVLAENPPPPALNVQKQTKYLSSIHEYEGLEATQPKLSVHTLHELNIRRALTMQPGMTFTIQVFFYKTLNCISFYI